MRRLGRLSDSVTESTRNKPDTTLHTEKTEGRDSGWRESQSKRGRREDLSAWAILFLTAWARKGEELKAWSFLWSHMARKREPETRDQGSRYLRSRRGGTLPERAHRERVVGVRAEGPERIGVRRRRAADHTSTATGQEEKRCSTVCTHPQMGQRGAEESRRGRWRRRGPTGRARWAAFHPRSEAFRGHHLDQRPRRSLAG